MSSFEEGCASGLMAMRGDTSTPQAMRGDVSPSLRPTPSVADREADQAGASTSDSPPVRHRRSSARSPAARAPPGQRPTPAPFTGEGGSAALLRNCAFAADPIYYVGDGSAEFPCMRELCAVPEEEVAERLASMLGCPASRLASLKSLDSKGYNTVSSLDTSAIQTLLQYTTSLICTLMT